MASEQARELRQQGIAAAKAGQKDQARQLLQQSIRLEPNNEAAWLWLASVARDHRERVFCLQKILEINPQNDTALKALRSLGLLPDENAPAGPSATTEPVSGATARPRQMSEQELLGMPPGVPMPAPEQVSEAQRQAEAILREYVLPLPSDVKWTHKTRRRAGEGDIVVYRLYLTAAVAGMVVLLFVIGAIIVLTNDDLRSVVIAPTATPTSTPTITPTFTPGFTPTPSPTPQRSPTPTPTPPLNLTPARPFELVAATAIYPPVLEKALEDAVNALNRGQAAAVIPTLRAEQALTANRFNPNPYYYEALAHLQLGDFEAALDILDAAESRLPEAPNENYRPLVDSGFAQVYWAMAQDALERGARSAAQDYLDAAEERAQAALQRDPRLVEPYLLLARLNMRQRRFDAALEILDQGLNVAQLSANTALLVEKGRVYLAQRDYGRADYQAYLALYVDPTHEDAHRLRVETALAQGRPGQAVLYAQDYLFHYPGSVLAHRLLGDARMAEGNPDLALHAYTQALAGDTADAETALALVARANLYNQFRRFDLAREDLTAALALTDDPAVRAQRMLAAYRDGRYQTALADAEALIGRDVMPDAELQLLRARILIDEARPGEGESNYQQALSYLIELRDDATIPRALQPIIQEYLARAYLALGEDAAALAAIDAALASGQTAERHYLRGLALEARGELAEALREFEWALAWAQFYPFSQQAEAEARLDQLRAIVASV